MNRIIIFTFVVLLCIAGSVIVIAPLIAGLVGVDVFIAQKWTFIITGIIGIILEYSQINFRPEYDVAYKIAYTPKNKYGWYGLIFFITVLVDIYLWAYFTRL